MAGELRARDIVGRLPWALIVPVVALCAVAVINLASAARNSEAHVPWAQLRWYGVGLVAAGLAAVIDYRRFEQMAYFVYGGVILMLVAVLGLGAIRMGAQRWLALGPLTLQPSEPMKFAVVLALARYFHNRADPGPFRNRELLIPFVLLGLPFALILKQPDLGTATVVLLIGLSVVLYVGLRFWSLMILGGAAVGTAVLGWFFVLRPYQKQRILTFLNPEADALGTGYHANQSIIAVGSGQMTGKGWGEGTQTQLSFLPEHHTDFVFSVWCEEHGFVGALMVIGLYIAILAASLSIAREAKDRFGALVAVGVAANIFWQMFINMAMVTGLAPVVGVTLPLFSYGGSSVLTVFLGLGLLVNVYARRRLF
jgi:rod shape determining protein RodA